MFKETKIVLAMAILVGLIYLFPHLIYLAQPGTYNPLYISQNRGFMDEAIYSAGVQEVLEGRIIPTDLAVFEHKHSLMIYGPIPFFIIAMIVTVLGSITSTMIISDFIFSALTFILFYLLTKKITSSHHIALISSTLLLFFYRIFIPPPTISLSYLKEYLLSIFINPSQGNANLWLSRFMHPQITLPLLLLTILVAWKAYETKQRRYFMATAVLVAANMYSYFYNWTYVLVFIIIFFATYLLVHVDDLKKRVLTLIITTFLTFILAIPHIRNTIALKALDITARSGIEYGRNSETISYLFLVLFSAVLLITYQKHNINQKHKSLKTSLRTMPSSSILLLSLLLSSFVVLNIQLLIGYTIQNDHYYSRILVPIAILSFTWIFASLPSLPKLLQKKYVTPMLLTFLFMSAIIVQLNEVQGQRTHYSFSSQELELLNIIQSLPPEGVILTSSITWNLWIPAYTTSNVYFPYSASTIASKEEMENRFITTFQLLQYSPDEVNELLTAKSSYTRIPTSPPPTDLQTYMRSYIYLDEIYPVEKQGTMKIRIYHQEPVQRLIERYQNINLGTTNQNVTNRPNIPVYRLDYILLTSNEIERLGIIKNGLQQRGYVPTSAFENKGYILLKLRNGNEKLN